ncbi:MAG: hypothetical protein AAFN07_17365, partial [Pseudomonadota bacterium]
LLRLACRRNAILAVTFVIGACANSPWSASALERQRVETRESPDFVPWGEAEPMIVDRCAEIGGIYQGHSRVVMIGFEAGDTITTITPEIDQILEVIRDCHPKHRDVPVLME